MKKDNDPGLQYGPAVFRTGPAGMDSLAGPCDTLVVDPENRGKYGMVVCQDKTRR